MPDEEENRREIDEATSVLENVLIPACAKELTELVSEQSRNNNNDDNNSSTNNLTGDSVSLVSPLRVNEFLHEVHIFLFILKV